MLRSRGRVDAGFIVSYEFPAGMLDRALTRCPAATDAVDLVAGLRQFFLVAGQRAAIGATVAMPSRVVDEAWHEFITYTRDYAAFCDRAFGRFLHHDPEVAMTADQARTNRNEAFAAAWVGACEQESRDPWSTHRAPLLFRLDRDSGLPGALSYVATCGHEGTCGAEGGTVCMRHRYLGGRPSAVSKADGTAPAAWGSSWLGMNGGGADGHSGCGGGGCGGGS